MAVGRGEKGGASLQKKAFHYFQRLVSVDPSMLKGELLCNRLRNHVDVTGHFCEGSNDRSDELELELELISSRLLWERGEKGGASLQKQARVRALCGVV